MCIRFAFVSLFLINVIVAERVETSHGSYLLLLCFFIFVSLFSFNINVVTENVTPVAHSTRCCFMCVILCFPSTLQCGQSWKSQWFLFAFAFCLDLFTFPSALYCVCFSTTMSQCGYRKCRTSVAHIWFCFIFTFLCFPSALRLQNESKKLSGSYYFDFALPVFTFLCFPSALCL